MTNLDIASLVLRAFVGTCIFLHGANKWKSPDARRGTAGWFGSIGMKWPNVQAFSAAFTEMIAGILLIVGLIVPTAAGAVASTMVVAIVVAHRRNGFFIFNEGQGWEYCAAIIVSCLAIGAVGGGRVSLDHAFGLEYSGNSGFLATFVLAVVAPGIHLALSYRPGKR